MGTETTGFVHVKGLDQRIKEAERLDYDISPLLGIRKRPPKYRCWSCKELTDGITSHKGFIVCKPCKKLLEKL